MIYRRDYFSKPFSVQVVQLVVPPQSTKEHFKQTPADRNLAILRYLRKWDGDWKNKNEIGTHHGVTINPKRLVPVLDELIERGLIEKRPSENPQARPWEYKITLLGKEKLEICESIVRDPTLKFVFGLKRKDTDELL